MTEEEVVKLMSGAASEEDWNRRCDQVKAACGGYPDFWYRAVILSGVARRAQARWSEE